MSTRRSQDVSAEVSIDIYNRLRRNVLRITLGAGFALLPFAAFLRENVSIRSLVLGLAVALVSFHLLSRSVEAAARYGEKRAGRHAVRLFIARYGIIAAGLTLAARYGKASILAFAAGLLVPQAAMAVAAFAARRIGGAGEGSRP